MTVRQMSLATRYNSEQVRTVVKAVVSPTLPLCRLMWAEIDEDVITYREVQQDRRRVYKRNNDVRSPYHCGRGKAIHITYSECVFVAFFIQYAERMRHILLSPLVCMFLPFFSTFSHYRHQLPVMCVRFYRELNFRHIFFEEYARINFHEISV